jgi:hypothetical protein
LAGDFGAFLFLFLGEDFLHDGCLLPGTFWRLGRGEFPDSTVGEGERQPERGRGGGSWK